MAAMIKEWGLYFDKAHGYENRLDVVKAFANFWENVSVDKIDIPGKCMLGGRVFGREGFDDGDEILTSHVQSIERVERGDRNGVPHDLMCATTEPGSKYYLYLDDYNAYAFKMLGDFIHKGELSNQRYHYLPCQLVGSQFI